MQRSVLTKQSGDTYLTLAKPVDSFWRKNGLIGSAVREANPALVARANSPDSLQCDRLEKVPGSETRWPIGKRFSIWVALAIKTKQGEAQNIKLGRRSSGLRGTAIASAPISRPGKCY